jgi:outer membrane protein
MKTFRKMILSTAVIIAGVLMLCSASNDVKNGQTLKIAIVNFKKVVEQSKLGKQEQSNFEALRKQMEAALDEKEKVLNEIATKFNDPDYLDSLTPEAENELKHKFRALNAELTQQQNQYYQSLNQTNGKVIQKLAEAVTQATQTIAKSQQYDLVLNEDSAFYWIPTVDISTQVITAMDKQFESEASAVKSPDAGS